MRAKKEEIKYTQHIIEMTPDEVQTVRTFLNTIQNIYTNEQSKWNFSFEDVVDFINGEVDCLEFPQTEIRYEIEG